MNKSKKILVYVVTVNDDGVTNITDASIIALWVVGIGELTCLSSADVNGDGVVNITDASNIALSDWNWKFRL